MWHGNDFHRLGAQGVESLILFDALFSIGGGRRREGKNKVKEKKLLWERRFSFSFYNSYQHQKMYYSCILLIFHLYHFNWNVCSILYFVIL
jgi:hypothetical protein